MAEEYLLVDGYNIIHAWKKLEKLAEHSLKDARDKLIDILSNYQAAKGINVIVVFDAYLVKGGKGSIQKYDGIYVVYTKEAETADNYIEATVHKLAKNYNVRVATSDGLEQLIILGGGAIRVSARELELEIGMEEKKISEQINKRKPIKEHTLFDSLDPEMAEYFEKMRLQ